MLCLLGNLAPQLGAQLQTVRHHAIQLEAMTRLKGSARQAITKNPKWNMIEPMLESILGCLIKTQDEGTGGLCSGSS